MGNGVDLRMLANNGGSVVISDYGAHLLRWAPAGQADVVWTPSTWHIEAGKSLGGGVPICFPWFGPGLRMASSWHSIHPTVLHVCVGGRWTRVHSTTATYGMCWIRSS